MPRSSAPLLLLLAVTAIWGYTFVPVQKAVGVYPLFAFLAVRFLILPLIHKWDAFHEFILLVAVGWCLTVATLTRVFGLSFEIGAFIAGVSLATSPIALYIAENLRPLRDFFLVLFFFSVGAAIDMSLMIDVWLPTLTLAVTLVAIKPVTFVGSSAGRAKRATCPGRPASGSARRASSRCSWCTWRPASP